MKGTEMRSKKGSYILEATMFLPVLILCVCALILVIRIIGVCEGVCFATAQEIKENLAKTYNNIMSVSLCKNIEDSVLEEEESLRDFEITRFRYGHSRGDIDDLIVLEGRAAFNVANGIGINGRIEFEEKLMVRGFTGTTQRGSPLGEDEFTTNVSSYKVVIFPKYGRRYHKESCRYVKQEKGQESCTIIMEKEDARRKGYTPCQVCGGAADV